MLGRASAQRYPLAVYFHALKQISACGAANVFLAHVSSSRLRLATLLFGFSATVDDDDDDEAATFAA